MTGRQLPADRPCPWVSHPDGGPWIYRPDPTCPHHGRPRRTRPATVTRTRHQHRKAH